MSDCSPYRPKLALVGRPNVGKSALFNCIAGQRIAIVDEAEGITRDRLYAPADFFGMPIQLVDTGGIDPRSRAPFNEQVKAQAELAIREADVLILVVDAHVGLTDLDFEVAQVLHRTKKPLCVAVNKLDSGRDDHLVHQFQPLGIPAMVAVSATQKRQIAELLEAAFEGYQAPKSPTEEKEAPLQMALVGRANVGKSSLINYWVKEERCIVSPIPGTTRDSIDIGFRYKEQELTLIDTAGVRRKHAEHEVVDKFAAIRTQRAIERADVCVLMLDAREGMTTRDKKIANMIEEAKKGCILLLNKWDLVHDFRMEHCLRAIQEEVPFLQHCPALCISAKTGRNVEKVFEEVLRVAASCEQRVSTHQLNEFLQRALQLTPPPMIKGKRLRIYYMTQISTKPPQFVLFTNYPDLLTRPYKRYLFNRFREAFGFDGAPVQFFVRGKKRDELKSAVGS